MDKRTIYTCRDFPPQERLDYMMKTAGVKLVITDDYVEQVFNLRPHSGRQSNERRLKTCLTDRSTPDGLAYILYTSGTTCKPKGVIQENHSVVNNSPRRTRPTSTADLIVISAVGSGANRLPSGRCRRW